MMWQPISGCGDQCRDGADARAPRGLASLRIVALAVVLVGGFLLVPLVRGMALRNLARTMLAVLGIKVVRQGPALRPGSLLAANHVSWLDILVLMAAAPAKVNVPPLLKGYLRLGAWVGGAPAHDPDFDCADFYVLLSLDRVNPRYMRHFLGQE